MKVKPLATIIVAVGLAMFLGGCSTIKGWMPLTPQEKQAQQLAQTKAFKEKCSHAGVLLSNLSKPVNARVYSLSPGVTCDD